MEYILSVIIFLPSIFAIAAIFFKLKSYKIYALIAALTEFLLTIFLWFNYDSKNSGMQFIEWINIYKEYGISYYVGVDSISLFLLIAIAFIILIAIYFLENDEDIKHSVTIILFLETAFMGIFLSLDFIFFYIFIELIFIPVLFSIKTWAISKRDIGLFFIYYIFSTILFLASISFLTIFYHQKTNIFNFNIINYYALLIDLKTQIILFFALFIAFILKFSLFPFDNFLKKIYKNATLSGSIVLILFITVFLYSTLRVIFPILSSGAVYSFIAVWIFAFIIAFYSLYLSFFNKNIKMFIFYGFFYYFAVTLFLIFTFDYKLISLVVILTFIYSILTVMQFYFANVLYIRVSSFDINKKFFLVKYTPIFFIFFTISTIIYYIAPLIMLYNLNCINFNNHKNLITFLIILFFALLFLISSFKYIFLIFFRKNGEKIHPKIDDLRLKEILITTFLIVIATTFIIYPRNILEPINKSTKPLVDFMKVKVKKVDSLNAI